jgi:hypothetical protein
VKKLTHEDFMKRVVDNNFHFKNGDCEVVGEYVNRKTQIECRCNIHNYMWCEYPEALYRGYSCPKCGNKKCKDEIGGSAQVKTFGDRLDLWTTHPHIAKLLKNPQDGYKYTHGSAKRLEFICPDCGASKFLTLNGVVHYGFSCAKCSDNISLPNKYARALLDQLLDGDYVCEYTPDWAKPYIYDNYFEYGDAKYILEMDGAYHYIEKSISKKPLSERQKDDEIKDRLATLNGVVVIRIDCSTSEIDFIRRQVLQSRLSKIFNLSKVDWNLCGERAQRSLVKQVCDMYMSRLYSLTEIEDSLHICRDTLIKYLKVGVKLDWCDYDVERARTYPKEIVVLDANNNIIHNFNGIRECARKMKQIYDVDMYRHRIVDACKTCKEYKGFNFRFLTDLQNEMIDTKEVA